MNLKKTEDNREYAQVFKITNKTTEEYNKCRKAIAKASQTT